MVRDRKNTESYVLLVLVAHLLELHFHTYFQHKVHRGFHHIRLQNGPVLGQRTITYGDIVEFPGAPSMLVYSFAISMISLGWYHNHSNLYICTATEAAARCKEEQDFCACQNGGVILQNSFSFTTFR